MTEQRFSRRAMLRGLGVSVALPWLESVSVLASDAGQRPVPRSAAEASNGTAEDAPLRFGVLFAGNGFHRSEWWA